MQFIPESRIDRELHKLIQLPVPYNLRRHFPYGDLGNRRMELLLYTLFRRGIASGWFKREFDRVQLSTTVPGLGRLLVLQYRQQWRGVVLCRRQQEKLHTPELVRQVLSFHLHRIAGALPDYSGQGFQVMVVAPDSAQPETRELAMDFSRQVMLEPLLPFWIRELIESQPGLDGLQFEMAEQSLYALLQQADVELVLPEHLDQRLAEQPDIKSMFFGVEMVSTEQQLRAMLGEFLLSPLEAGSREKLLNRMESAEDNRQWSYGLIRFMGYPRDFLQALVSDGKLREVMVKGAEFKAELDYAVLDFLHGKTVLISQVLLAEAPGSPLSPARLAIVPYLFSRIAIKYIKNSQSAILREIARSGARRDFYEEANLDYIKSDLLLEAEKLASAANHLPIAGDGRELSRLEVLRKAWLDCPDGEQLSARFDADWEALQPVIRAIEKKLLASLPKDPLVVLDDFGSLQSNSKLERLIARFRLRFTSEDRKEG